jgi:hypothetical protein
MPEFWIWQHFDADTDPEFDFLFFADPDLIRILPWY